jgi:uncharacterized protein YjbJ (UPF0337 family)
LPDIKDTVSDIKETVQTTAAPSSFKEKFKGFVTSVKEGASDAYESVSDSVSGATHKLDEKRKEVVAGTKSIVNGAITKIKNSFSKSHSAEDEPRDPESSEEHQKKPVQTIVDEVPAKNITPK